MNKFKVLAVIIAALLLTLCGCTQTPFQEYENFCDDMDLRARAEDYLTKAKDGDCGDFFEDELKTYIKDIQTFDYSDNPKAREISDYYILCARNMLLTITHNKNGDTASAAVSYCEAEANYAEAVMIYSDFTVKRND